MVSCLISILDLSGWVSVFINARINFNKTNFSQRQLKFVWPITTSIRDQYSA